MKQKTFLLVLFAIISVLGFISVVRQCSNNELTTARIPILPIKLMIKKAINQLGPKLPFVHFNLNLSEKDQVILQNLDVQQRGAYENFGKLNSLEQGIHNFLKTVGKNDEQVAAKAAGIITNLVHIVLDGSQKESAWVALRVFVATDEYEQPRWHRDGYYFSPFSGKAYKFVVTLKGAHTLFYHLPEKMQEHFSELEENQERAKLAEMLDLSQVSTAEPGQGTAFIVGAESSAVHSEPQIVGQRLFLSIVPGSQVQIDELDKRWHPTAHCDRTS